MFFTYSYRFAQYLEWRLCQLVERRCFKSNQEWRLPCGLVQLLWTYLLEEPHKALEVRAFCSSNDASKESNLVIILLFCKSLEVPTCQPIIWMRLRKIIIHRFEGCFVLGSKDWPFSKSKDCPIPYHTPSHALRSGIRPIFSHASLRPVHTCHWMEDRFTSE